MATTQNTLVTTQQCTKNHLEHCSNRIAVHCNHPQHFGIVVAALRASIFFTEIYNLHNLTSLLWPPQVIRKGEVSCCWTCTPCKENEFVFDEYTCRMCELGSWPTDDLTGESTSTFRAKCSSCCSSSWSQSHRLPMILNFSDQPHKLIISYSSLWYKYLGHEITLETHLSLRALFENLDHGNLMPKTEIWTWRGSASECSRIAIKRKPWSSSLSACSTLLRAEAALLFMQEP